MARLELMKKIKEEVLNLKGSPLYSERVRNKVFPVIGEGNHFAKIMFIGEAPGKNEAATGRPFCGAAGKILDELLEFAEIKREDVYITNIVKYRPPGNRDPLPEEKAAFLPFLMTQLKVIKPKLVATLGRHSMNCFLPDLSISAVHGQPKRVRLRLTANSLQTSGVQGADEVQGSKEKRTKRTIGTESESRTLLTQQFAASNNGISGFADKQSITSLVILPLFHPAAALYNGGMRQTLIDDFTRIPDILKLNKKTT